jgi:hypothetical protein
MKRTFKIFLSCLPGFLVVFFISSNIFAAQMQSSNYVIQSDDSLTSSGNDSASVNYKFSDTMGEFSTGLTDSTNYGLAAGYQEMQQFSITVSSPGDLTMLPAIPGMSGGTANASGSYNVIADGPSGFNMKIRASTAPAMLLVGDPTTYFSNYLATPSYNWSVSSGNAQFGFTVEPATSADTVQAFSDNGSNTCGTGSANGLNTCWAGFNSTSDTTIINRTSRTGVSGESEVIRYKAQANNIFLKSGNYSAGVTITVVTN